MLESGKTLSLIVISLAIVVIAVLRGLFSYFQLSITSRTGYQMVYSLRRELFVHLQRLSLSFHNRARCGELLTKVTGDTNTLKDAFPDLALAFAADLLTVIGMFGIMVALNWKLGLIVVAPFPIEAGAQGRRRCHRIARRRPHVRRSRRRGHCSPTRTTGCCGTPAGSATRSSWRRG